MENCTDLESTSKDVVHEFTDEQHHIYSAYTLADILMNNDKNIEDPDFVRTWEKFGNIGVAQLVDSFLYPEEFHDIIKPNFDNCMVLFKNVYNDAKIGETINGGKVIAVFTLTVWIYTEENTHEYCCDSEDCCKH